MNQSTTPSATSALTAHSSSTRAILRRVQEALAPYRSVLQGKRLLLAVSGGPDSMALLYVCRVLSAKYDWILGIAHVNYELRAADSDADEYLVRQESARYQISLYVHSPKSEQGNFPTDENTLRAIRYDFFRDVATREGYDYIVTGHTRSDQVETVLMRLIRGTGLQGLPGMDVLSQDILRPLLELSRADIMQMVQDESIPYRTDQSNTDPKYLRNRVRHELLPLLADLNPQAEQHILDFSRDVTSSLSRGSSPRVIEWVDGGVAATFTHVAWQELSSLEQKAVLDEIAQHFGLAALRRVQVENFQKWLNLVPDGGSTMQLGRLKCQYKHGILECRLP